MFARGLAAGITLSLLSVAQGGGVVDLVPDRPGPYLVGETLDVTFLLRQDPAGELKYVRLLQVDMTASDPALTLNSFAFDFSGVPICQLLPSMCGNMHSVFWHEDDFVVTLVYNGTVIDPMNQIKVPSSEPVTVGHLELTLPMTTGVYTLDVMNAGGTYPNEGAVVQFGPGCVQDCEWNPRPNPPWVDWPNLSGGVLELTVVPEPATLVLLGLSGLAVRRRRRRV